MIFPDSARLYTSENVVFVKKKEVINSNYET